MPVCPPVSFGPGGFFMAKKDRLMNLLFVFNKTPGLLRQNNYFFGIITDKC